MMDLILLAALLFVVAVVVAVLKVKPAKKPAKTPTEQRPYPYERKRCLMTEAELVFFHLLVKQAGPRIIVCPQVSPICMLRVTAHGKERITWVNRMIKKRVDFVLCELATMTPLVAVELDDSTHTKPKGIKRDRLVEAAFDDANLPLVRFKCSPSGYDESLIRQRLDDAIKTTLSTIRNA